MKKFLKTKKPLFLTYPPGFFNIPESIISSSYQENRFSRQDYLKLAQITSSTQLKRFLIGIQYRDKRFQRYLREPLHKCFYCNLDQVPLHMNPTYNDKALNAIIIDIVKWRLHINK